MSAFDPVDVRAPGDRRRRLLQKLTQQHQQRRNVPMPNRSGAFLGSPGRGLRNSLDFRGVPKVRQTHKNNILPSILAALGAGQNQGRPEEVSDVPGHEVAPPPLPVPPQAPPPPPPPAPAAAPEPEAAPSGSVVSPGLEDLVGDLIQDIHLGGGMYFNPNTGQTYHRPTGHAEF